MFRGGLLLLCVLSLLTEGVVRADDSLALARKSVAESDYGSARTQLATARDAGGLGPDETAELYRLSGIVAAALGDPKAATEAFTQLLAVSPKATLPAGTSPKITRPFDAAAKYFTNHDRLEVKVETRATPPAITLVRASDPLNMVAKAHVVFSIDGGPEQVKDVAAEGRTEIALPAGARIDARVAAVDAHGNHLVELGSTEVPIVIIGEAKPVVAAKPAARPVTTRIVPAAPRPIYLQWWPYAAGAVVFVGAAGYFAWQTHSDANELDRLNAQSAFHNFSDAKTVEDRGHRDALLTNIGLGITGALALTAGVFYLAIPRDHLETHVAAVPLPGGAAFVFGGNL